MKFRQIVLPAFAVLVAGCGGGEAKKALEKNKQGAEEATKTVVRVAEAVVRPMSQTIEITGSLDTLETVTLSPKLAGRLSRVFVQQGDHVSAGQLIAQQENADQVTQLAQAVAGVASARSALLQAQTDATTSPTQTEAVVRRAEAALRQAKAELKKLRDGARPQEIEQAHKQVEQAKLDWDWAQQDYERELELFRQEAVGKRDVDMMKVAVDKAKARYDSTIQALSLLKEGARSEDISAAEEAVNQAEQQVVSAKSGRAQDAIKEERVAAMRAALAQAQASVTLAKQQVENTEVYSPVAGQVQRRAAHPGQMLMPGAPIVEVVSLNSVYFDGSVPETQLRWVRIGQPVNVMVDAYPDKTWVGRVAAIQPVGDEQGRNFSVRVALDGSGGALKPGMFARGTISVRTVRDAVVVPKEALVSRSGKIKFYVVKDGAAQEREAITGLTDTQYVEVSGIQAGDHVVVMGADLLTNGAKVKVEKDLGSASSPPPAAKAE